MKKGLGIVTRARGSCSGIGAKIGKSMKSVEELDVFRLAHDLGDPKS